MFSKIQPTREISPIIVMVGVILILLLGSVAWALGLGAVL